MKSHKELYEIIKENGLENLIKEKAKKPYSNCSTELLDKLVGEEIETKPKKTSKVKKENVSKKKRKPITLVC